MKILVADDDGVSRKLLQRLLERSGFEVVCVADGSAAVACLLGPDAPRIAILDWMMPGADGPTICRKVRSRVDSLHTYIMLLSARDAIEDIVEGFDAGADDYLIKPFRPDELKVRIRVGQRCLQLQDSLIHEAQHDTLTGLPNRAFFVKRLTRSVGLARKDETYKFTLIFLDIDRFKILNDSLGHLTGDSLMRAVAQRILMAVRTDSSNGSAALHRSARGLPGDVVARVGGDEFVILLDNFADVDDGVRVAQRILQVLERPFDIEGREIVITASLGIASSEGGATVASDVLRNADSAMYRAKLLGRARYEVNTSGTGVAVSERIRLGGDLRRAIPSEELFVHYQPIVRLSDCLITGFEALARWHHPELGNVPPDTFIAIAEETGLILSLGARIMEDACKQAKMWNESFPSMPSYVCVNISPAQYCEDDLFARVRSLLDRVGLEPGCLALEVTENLTMQNVEQAAITLRDIRNLGVTVSLDDFGTGFSSLGYLLRFPIDTLKIDRSFLKGVEDDVERGAIVETIITLGHNLGMKVVAEGIENAAQCALLQSWGCDYGQGYYFSRGVSAAEATGMLRKQSRLAISLPSYKASCGALAVAL